MTAEKPVSQVDELVSGNNSSNMLESSEVDHHAEKKLVRKIDKFTIPTVMLAYLLCFLDRTNIGNARLFGMEEDLGLVGNQYQIAVALLFVPYVLIEVPSNLILKKFRPSRWLAFITVSWGITSTLTGIVQNFGGLIATRLLLGLFEGGLLPGLTVYLTLFYTKKEIALRIGYLFVSSALAGACGGLLSYGIGFMDGVAGFSGWRWVFILEGIPTALFGVALFFVLADEPKTAWYLTEDERQLLVARLQKQVGFHADFNKEDAILAVKDWKTWAFAVGQFTVNAMLYSYSVFLPSIIKGLGQWSTAQAQALTVPCYALGTISYLVVAWISDRQQLRGLYQVIFLAVCIVGYGISLAPASSSVHYFATFVISLGLFVAVGLPLAWLPSNNPRYGKRTTASGIQITICNCSGILAPFLYPSSDGPRYVMGYSVSMALLGLGTVIYGSMSIYLHTVNKRRKAGKEDHLIEGMSDEQVDALGDRNPRFVYTI